MFISLDGIDGVGKSTQIGLLAEWLRSRGQTVVTCRDPGSSKLGEALREIILHREEIPLCAESEMLLYMASRGQLVSEVIRPALENEKTVICDRYLLANVVYQGHAGGLDVEALWQVGRIATAGVLPNLTIILDLSAETAATRLSGPKDRLERRGLEYMIKLREGFLVEAQKYESIVVVDADQSIEQIAKDIQAAVLLAEESMAG